MKRMLTALLCAAILARMPGLPLFVHAEEPDFSDTSYWNSLCSGDELSDEEASDCKAYLEYMQGRNQQLHSEISEIDSRKEEISANIESYSQQIEGYNAQIAGINSMIADLTAQISAVEEQVKDIQERISANEKAITAKENEIEELKARVKVRMEEQQKTMHFYQFLDVLMGAESFDDFVRLASGINSIYERDNYSLSSLNDSISELNELKEGLLADQEEVRNMEAELELGKQALDSQQAALLSSRYELDLIRQSYNEQLALAENERTNAESTIASNDSAMNTIRETLNSRKESSKDSDSSDTSSASDTPSSSSAPSSSTPVPSSSGSSSSVSAPETNGGGNPYYGGWANCTWGTWQLVHDTLGISLPGWGMAGNWLNDAAASGYATGSTPRVNSIAVYSWHVAFVTAVDGDRVYIKEGNYMGHYYERWVPADGLPYTGQTCLGYIYL